MGSIRVENLGKAYKQYPTRWSRLLEWILPFAKSRHQLKWILQDINFQVVPGEAVGIIGINGAGKSTLLKLITGTTQPTTGSVKMEGRVAALLELGMGFHPDFTGRQNAFMAGQLLGLTSEDIGRLMPGIEGFADIGDYIDQPVRVYSSGMQMRLAFSVATVVRPDILIVDEALSVGDSHFQHKSFDRIRQYREQGTTLLIVSHDKQAIQSICDRAILLSAGRIAMQGEPEAVMDYYNAMLAERGKQTVNQEQRADGRIQTISGTGEATIKEIGLYNHEGNKIEVVTVGEAVELKVYVKAHKDIPKLVLGYMIKDRLGQPIFGTTSEQHNIHLSNVKSGSELVFIINFAMNIGEGTYSIATALASGSKHVEGNQEWRDLALIFNVINTSKKEFIGAAWIEPEISVSVTGNK
jgi:lipopolysaccharide transport system ATP-binding protein